MKCTKCGLIQRTVADIVGCQDCADGTAAQVKHLPYETQIEHAMGSVLGLANRFIHHAEDVIKTDAAAVEDRLFGNHVPDMQAAIDEAYQKGLADAPKPEDPADRAAAIDAAKAEGHAAGWAEAKADSASAQAALNATKAPAPDLSSPSGTQTVITETTAGAVDQVAGAQTTQQ